MQNNSLETAYYTIKFVLFRRSPQKELKLNVPFAAFLFLVSVFILCFIFFSALVSTVGFFFYSPITETHFLLAIILSTLSIFYFANVLSKKYALMQTVLVIVLTFLVFSAAQKAVGNFYDLSYDGQTYHQETIIALANNWNPFYQKLTPEATPTVGYQRLVGSYPKILELVQAVMYKHTGHIEESKAFTLIFALMAFSLVFTALGQILGGKTLVTLITSIMLMLNPIVILQSLTFYIDGQLYLLFLSFGALLVLYYFFANNLVTLLLIMSTALLWNFKVTAIFTTSVTILCFVLFYWFHKQEDIVEKISSIAKLLIASMIAGVIALFVLGFNPYLTNTLNYKNPFYPVVGKSTSQYVTGNMPESLFKKTTLERMLISMFSETSGVRREGKVHQLKIPFTYTQKELSTLPGSATLGGFGPLFGGVLIITFIVLNIIAVLESEGSKELLFVPIGILLLTCIIIPVASYARFIPQFWIIPCLTFLYALRQKKLLLRSFAFILITIMVVNLYLISNTYFRFNSQKSDSLRTELSELKKLSQTAPLTIDFDVFGSNRIRFKEAGIRFTEVTELNCAPKERILAREIPEAKIEICSPLTSNQFHTGGT